MQDEEEMSQLSYHHIALYVSFSFFLGNSVHCFILGKDSSLVLFNKSEIKRLKEIKMPQALSDSTFPSLKTA